MPRPSGIQGWKALGTNSAPAARTISRWARANSIVRSVTRSRTRWTSCGAEIKASRNAVWPKIRAALSSGPWRSPSRMGIRPPVLSRKARVVSRMRPSSPSRTPGWRRSRTFPMSSPMTGLTAGKSFSHQTTSAPKAEGMAMTPSVGQRAGTRSPRSRLCPSISVSWAARNFSGSRSLSRTVSLPSVEKSALRTGSPPLTFGPT